MKLTILLMIFSTIHLKNVNGRSIWK